MYTSAYTFMSIVLTTVFQTFEGSTLDAVASFDDHICKFGCIDEISALYFSRLYIFIRFRPMACPTSQTGNVWFAQAPYHHVNLITLPTKYSAHDSTMKYQNQS